MTNYNALQNAKMDGELALESLYAARKYLSRARGWGILDIGGGSFWSGAFKHSGIRKANSCIQGAGDNLRNFINDINGLDLADGLKVEVGTLLTLMDFFYDGLFSDVLVQAKIKKGIRNIDEAISSVKKILRNL